MKAYWTNPLTGQPGEGIAEVRMGRTPELWINDGEGWEEIDISSFVLCAYSLLPVNETERQQAERWVSYCRVVAFGGEETV